MGSAFQYNILAGFRAVSQWQENIIKNAQGLLVAGYNNQVLNLGGSGTAPSQAGYGPTQGGGSRNAINSQSDGLALTGNSIDFQQGTIDPAFSPTSLAIRGDGFFVLAENLNPGAKLFLTRNGDFHYDTQGHLVNSQGLFVAGGGGKVGDPITPITDPGDGTVALPSVTLARIPVRSQLAVGLYGDTIYRTTPTSGPMQFFANGRPEVGFVQSSSLEMPSRVGANAIITEQVTTALQHYKIIKDMLDNFNKTDDDALGLVK